MADGKSKTPAGTGKVPVHLIREGDVALRDVNRQDENYLHLVESIREKGVLNSITVREVKKDGETYYGLIDGRQRLNAAKDAGLKEIPANIVSMNDGDVLEAQIVANLQKIETKPVEYSRQLVRIVAANPLMTKRELAKRISCDVGWLNKRLSLLNLGDKIGELVDEGKIGLANAYALAKLPEDEQADYVDRAMSDSHEIFIPLVHKRGQEIKAAKREGRKVEEKTFEPHPFLRNVKELKTELDTAKNIQAIIQMEKATTPEEGGIAVLKWVLHMDSESVKAQFAKEEQRKKAIEARKEKAKAEREARKAKEAAEAAADVQSL